MLKEIFKQEGDTVESLELLALIAEGEQASGGASSGAAKKAPATAPESATEKEDNGAAAAGPAARKLMAEHDLDPAKVTGSGKGGRVTREDVEQALKAREQKPAAQAAKQAAPAPAAPDVPAAAGEREERRVPMTRLRKRIAERLIDAQQTAAILTTFNEVNMKPIMDMRKHYQGDFEKAHGVRLGFMSFFVRACVEALKRYPVINASIDGDDVVYHGFYDIGVAVSSDRGLVVPIIRDADQKGLAEVESQIIAYGNKAKDGKLSIDP